MAFPKSAKMKNLTTLLLLFFSTIALSQINNQTRFNSDSRQFYVWSDEKDGYEFRETEYEHSIIDIREIGSKSNGYIAISITDNGKVRMYHGSITDFTQAEGEGSWLMRSKEMKGKLTFNPEKKTLTFLFEADDKRYKKIFIFEITPDF
jgi:hypothetical protein